MRLNRSLLIWFLMAAPLAAWASFSISLGSLSSGWSGVAGDAEGRMVRTTADGGFVVAGYTFVGPLAIPDAWVLKFDSSGALQWQKAYGGSGYDRATSIEPTGDGGFIVGGTTTSFGPTADFQDYNVWVFKLDASGNLQWQRFLDNPPDVDFLDKIVRAVPVQGGYLVAAEYWVDPNAGQDDVWIIKLDSAGNILWQKRFGGTEGESPWDIRPTSDGGAVVVGYTWSYGIVDCWLLKLDANGNVQWQRRYSINSYVQPEYGTSVVPTSDGGYLFVGFEEAGITRYPLAFKLDGNGNVVWQKRYSPLTNGLSPEAIPREVQQTPDGGYIVAGSIPPPSGGGAGWLMKLDGSGNVMWSKMYSGFFGGAEFASVVPTTNGYVAVGSFYLTEGDVSIPWQLWAVGVDPAGNLGGACPVEDVATSVDTGFFANDTALPEAAPSPPTGTDPPTLTVTTLVPWEVCGGPASADMRANAPSVPPSLSPGGNYSLSFSCTNNGPGAATNATCGISASVGMVSGVNCLPPVPVLSLPSGGTISCTYTFTAPGTPGGGNTPETGVTFTVTAGSATTDPNTANNTATSGATPVPIVDALNDAASFPANTSGATFNVGSNDQYGTGSLPTTPAPSFTLLGSTTCAGASINASSGVATFNVPTSGSCTVEYRVCVVSGCDTATLTVTAQQVEAIPTLQEWGMVALTLLVASTAVLVLRRRMVMS